MNTKKLLTTLPKAFTEDELYAKRREPLLNYVDEYQYLIDKDTARISQGLEIMANPNDANWGAAGLIAEFCTEILRLQYSAGDSLENLRNFYPSAIEAWEQFLVYKRKWHDSEDFVKSMSNRVPAISFADQRYANYALPMACFGILLKHTELLPRLTKVWDYINEELDYYDILLERLVSPYVEGRDKQAKKYTRHLPYRKLDKVFQAPESKRPALMQKYLDEWYQASRREPYYESAGDICFMGYWSYEAAAVTYLLNIDDSSYKDMDFYPKDLVEFARSNTKDAD